MTKLFALLAVLLIVTGAVLVAAPLLEEPGARSLGPTGAAPPTVVSTVRDIAEQVNAPLSIVFGLMSLYYSRRTYLERRAQAGRQSGAP